jgi:hypothetical protein
MNTALCYSILETEYTQCSTKQPFSWKPGKLKILTIQPVPFPAQLSNLEIYLEKCKMPGFVFE